MPPGYQPGGATPLAGGVPWESGGGLLSRWWATMTAVSFRGRELFAAARESDDAVRACMFSMTTGTMFGAVLGLFYVILLAIWGAAVMAFVPHRLGLSAASVGLGAGVLLWLGCIVMGCVGGFIGPWIMGGIHHLVLAILGGVGQGKGYAHSVRVNAYAQSAAYLWVPIPVLGGLVSLVFSAKNHVEGYDVTHGCGGGKAFLAWVSPFLCCCCSYFVMGMMFGLAGSIR